MENTCPELPKLPIATIETSVGKHFFRRHHRLTFAASKTKNKNE